LNHFLSSCFERGVSARHWLYDKGWLKIRRAPLPVISIGNILAGGTGKTQLALFLANKYIEAGYRVAILSRGYRRVKRIKDPFVVDTKVHSPQDTGDEPWLMAARLPQACVIVSRDRFQGAQLAQQKGADLVILDDGMQHRRLARDVEIVIVQSSNPFGGGHFLPKGGLRENPKRLKEADCIVVNGDLSVELKESLQKIKPGCLMIEMKIVPSGVRDLQGNALSLKGVSVGVFCGIGNPQNFVTTVHQLEAQIVDTLFLADHRSPSKKVLEKFGLRTQEKGGKWLVCTEKDKIKLPPLSSSLSIGWVQSDVSISAENQKNLEQLANL